MICANCGTQNEAHRKFCGECGARLAALCTSCGAANPATVRFCGECGTSLAGDAGAGADAPARSGATNSPPAMPTSELRHVSVLFADLVGFTGLSEERDAEAVRELLGRYYESARTVVERYGGTIEKFIGDAVMAVWGTPVAHEDDAERTVRAALDLVEAVHALEAGSEVDVRAAVMSGEAAVTIGATNQGMVAGDLVNTASRLQSVAPPGTVLVGETTYRAAGSAIAFESVGSQDLRGKVAPVSAYRALRVVGKRGGIGRTATLEAPFVGRDAELRLVRELYHATARDGRARLVSVVGQAGIGKSRLLWEFSKYTDGLAENMFWHQGRSPSYGEGVTFWALGEMLRQRAGILEGEGPEPTRVKLAETVAEYVRDEADQRWIEPALRQLLGVHDGRPLERDELFAAWRTFFERLAQRQPTVFVFEDLHWADSGLLDFIEHVLEWSRNLPIYIVTLARPELLERRPTWGAGQRSFTSLSLEPLPVDAMRELLEGLVPGLPPAVVRAILDRAEGVPLYAVETVRMLLNDGALEVKDGTYRPAGDLSRIAVPDSLQTLISARLDSLDQADRSLVQDGAVLGHTFPIAALASISGHERESLEPRLRALVRREILDVDADPRSPERGQYGFVQALMRDVAYGRLTKKERRTRHLAAARYFESLDDDELAGVLARHYLDAHRSSAAGPEADAVGVQARLALRAAAERAVSLGSHEQAVSYLEGALSVTSDARERAEILEHLATSTSASGHYEAADSAFRAAAQAFGDVGDRPSRARLLANLGTMLGHTGHESDEAEVLRAAAAEFADIDDHPEVVRLRMRLASSLGDSQPHEALGILEGALERAEHLDLDAALVDGLNIRAGILLRLGRRRESSAVSRGARSLAEEYGHRVLALRAQNQMSFLEVTADPRAGLSAGREGIDTARRLGQRDWVFGILGNAMRCAFRLGEWDWLESAIDEATALAPEGFNDAELSGGRVVVRSLRGGDAGAEVRRIDALVATLDDRQSEAWQGIVKAWVAFAAGDFDGAYRLARDAADKSSFYAAEALPLAGHAAARRGQADRVGSTLGALDAHGWHGAAVDADRLTLRASLAASLGDERAAGELFRSAITAWTTLDCSFDLALCTAGAAQLLPLDAEAARWRGVANDVFTRIRATPFILAASGASPVEAPPRQVSTAAPGAVAGAATS
jgi:class 3 adenylate cyclase/tetratricopeptide (TPR) repeat protein